MASYEYSADKLLASRISDGVTQKFVWDTNRTIPVMLSDGKYEYLYKVQSERVPFAQVELSTGVVTYLHSDLTGSVTASTSVSGELLGTVDYSPYGEATGPLLSAFGYAGEWVDNITGYTYLRMRWLDTATGTFLSEDPLVQATNSAFNYTEGNPITQIDPLGLMPVGTTPVLTPEQSEQVTKGEPHCLEMGKTKLWMDFGRIWISCDTLRSYRCRCSLGSIFRCSRYALRSS